LSTMVWLLVYSLIQLPVYLLFRKARNRVDQLVEGRFVTISSRDVRQEEMGEIVAVVTLGNFRKKIITGFMLMFVVAGFLGSWGAGGGPQPSKEEWETQWPLLVSFIVLCYSVGGTLPWLGAIYYYGESRVVTRNGILKVSSLTRTYFVRWDQIDFIDVREGSAASWWFIVRTKKGSFSVWNDCVNLGVFIEGIVKNVPKEIWRPLVDRGKIAVRNEQV